MHTRKGKSWSRETELNRSTSRLEGGRSVRLSYRGNFEPQLRATNQVAAHFERFLRHNTPCHSLANNKSGCASLFRLGDLGWTRRSDLNRRVLTQTVLQAVAFDRTWLLRGSSEMGGTDGRTRTFNLWFWRPALCQLSYKGTELDALARHGQARDWWRRLDSNQRVLVGIGFTVRRVQPLCHFSGKLASSTRSLHDWSLPHDSNVRPPISKTGALSRLS